MPEIEIHEHETDQDTETFLNEKREDFKSDALFLLHLLYRGHRLNGRQVEMWGINSRRLRELVVSHKEVKKEWKIENGKRVVMEYFMQIPKQETKESLQNWFRAYQGRKRTTSLHSTEFI